MTDASSSKSAKTSRAEAMLAALRAHFITDLPKKFDDCEQLILNMGEGGDFGAQFDELFRRIHSLKGSAGTHGLQVYTNICHQLEDQLRLVDGRQEKFTPHYVNSWLAYVDLMREVLANYQKNIKGPDFEQKLIDLVQDKLDALRQGVHSNGLTAMVVASSRSIESICRSVVEDLNYNYSIVNDGYLALGRLLNEKIDVLVTTKEVRGLNGDVLITAIKLAHHKKHPIKTLLLTSESVALAGRSTDPDITIARDTHLVVNLTETLRQIAHGKS